MRLIILFVLAALNGAGFAGSAKAKSIASEGFFSKSEIRHATVSPDGQWVATIKVTAQGNRVDLLNVKSGKEVEMLDVSKLENGESGIRRLVWIDNKHIATELSEYRKGVEDLIDSRVSSRLVIIVRPTKGSDEVRILSVRTKGALVHALPAIEGEFLYAKSGAYSKVYRLNVDKLSLDGKTLTKRDRIDGGQFKKSNEVAKVKGVATRWLIDEQGQPDAVLHISDKETLSLSQIESKNKATLLQSWAFKSNRFEAKQDDGFDGKVFIPVAKANEPNSYFCFDKSEDVQRSIYKVNFDTKAHEVVYQSDSFKILDFELTAQGDQIIYVKVINEGKVEYVYTNNTQAQSFELEPLKSATLRAQIGANLDDSIKLYYLESHNNPGQYVLSDNKGGNIVRIGSILPKLDGQLEFDLIESSVEVEGLNIPTLLSIAKGKKAAPLIVIPHGGPFGIFDDRYFDRDTAFFVSHGYAVLRVNFRGSGGYSKDFVEAGKKQWGKLMLEDIYQATLATTTRADIDQNRVCVVGSSYGGFAALMLSIDHPELFKCAATLSGVTDFNLILNRSTNRIKTVTWNREHHGDPFDEYELIKQRSPVYLAQNLKNPVFIFHGEKDRIVNVEHAYRLKLMLEKYNKPFEWQIDPQGKHAFTETKAQTEIYEKLLAFVGKHI